MFILVVARYGVVGERAATALRIAGTVTQNQDPYRFASLNTVYQAADNAYNASSDQQKCTPPDSQILYGEGLLSGAASANFWNPSSIPSAPTCTFSMKLFKNTAVRSEGDLLVHQFDYTISAEAGGWTSSIADAAGTLFGGTTRSIAESARFYQAPSLETLIQCYSHLGPAVSATLNPPADVSNAQQTDPLTQGEAAAIHTSLVVSPTSCGGFALAAGPYQIPPAALPFPDGAAPAGTLTPPKNSVWPGSPSSGTLGGSTHGSFSRIDAYQPPSTPAPPSTPKPIKPPPSTPKPGKGGSSTPKPGTGGSSTPAPSKPTPSSGNTSGNSGSSSTPASTKGGSGGSTSAPGSSSKPSGGSSAPATSTNGGSGSGTITL